MSSQSTYSTAVRCPLSGKVHSSRMTPDPVAYRMALDRLDDDGAMEFARGFGVPAVIVRELEPDLGLAEAAGPSAEGRMDWHEPG
jgi:hypothetical protein